jgi:hypothetical protein
MLAGGAQFGSLWTFVDIPTVAAVPLDRFVAFEDPAVPQVVQEFQVAALVLFFGFSKDSAISGKPSSAATAAKAG